MVLLENVRIALQSLFANPLRSLLTLVGIAVGIAAVLHVVSLGEVTQARINERLEALGTNILIVRPGYSRMFGVRTAERAVSLDAEQAGLLEEESNVITAAVPTYSQDANAELGATNWRTRVTGTTAPYFSINNESFVAGRPFNEEEVAQRARVAVLGDTVWDELFERSDPIGSEIAVNTQRFTVVGVLGAKGESWGNPDDQIFVPLTTAHERLFGKKHVSNILVQMRAAGDFDEALFDIETILRRNHRLRVDQDNDFRVRRQDFYLSTIQDTNRDIARFVIIIAGVSLFVGGLGIANVMLVSVTERTREIGIRRSQGANRAHILLQFLTEAIVLGVVGGLVGVSAGLAFNQLQIGEGAPVSVDWVAYSFAICAGIGAISGFYPAMRAAAGDVIEALRYE